MTRHVIDLHRLPLWAQYAIAVLVAAVVMLFAWHVGSGRLEPAWLEPLLNGWILIGPALIVFFLVKWLVGKIRRR